jgi:hypothetical protein
LNPVKPYLKREKSLIPRSLLVGTIVGQPKTTDLRRRQVTRHMHRDFLHAEKFSGSPPQVTDDDYVV